MASHTPRRKRPTNVDVARRAGVSAATVSYILNGTSSYTFSDDTKRAVVQAAADLGYRPNAAARSLAAGVGPVLVVLPPSMLNQLTASLVFRISSGLAKVGVLVSTHFQTDGDSELINAIRDLCPRGVVLYASPSQALKDELLLQDIPVIQPYTWQANPISIASMQISHLASRGHRRMAYASLAGNDYSQEVRPAELTAACHDLGLVAPTVADIDTNGCNATEVVLGWHKIGVTAVISYNDDVALAVLHGIRTSGLRCPEDIAVIGADGIPASACSSPPLTTVRIDSDLAAEWSIKSILFEIDGQEHPPSPASMIEIVERASA